MGFPSKSQVGLQVGPSGWFLSTDVNETILVLSDYMVAAVCSIKIRRP